MMVKRNPRTGSNFLFYFLIAGMILSGCLRVISTYRVFSQTWDEPAHIAAGMQWLEQGRYTFEPLHPPLARVMSALGLYLEGLRFEPGVTDDLMWEAGNALLHTGGQYERNLSLARLGILPFFILACLVVARWAKDIGGQAASLLATFLFTTLPPVLAHAGLATTDMANAAFIAASLYLFSLWQKRITLYNSLLLGLVLGLAALSKLTALYFLGVSFPLAFIATRLPAFGEYKTGRDAAPPLQRGIILLAVVLLIFALTVWAGYRFSLDTLLEPANQPFEKVDRIVGESGALHDLAYFVLGELPVPAQEFFIGIYTTFLHNQVGRTTYLLGKLSTEARWYFYPVVFFYKTPLPFLLLCLAGLLFNLRDMRRRVFDWTRLSIPLLAILVIFSISMTSNMNLGLRQILSVYPLLAIVAGYGVLRLLAPWKKPAIRRWALVAVCLAWQLGTSTTAHPDYLAYFNELAGDHPEKIAIDSDLDWGQDLLRLSQTLQSLGVAQLSIGYYGSQEINLDKFGLPAWQELEPYQKETGWVAISLSLLMFESGRPPNDQFAWLEEYQPVMRVGKTILLYYIPAISEQSTFP